MSSWLGYRNIGEVLTFAVNTHSASTGAATDADAVPSYRVYEDETGTAILTGSMAKLDDTNTTGFYSEQLTLSGNPGNGFEEGKCYSIYISAAVGSVTGTTERHFSIWPAAINSTIGADVVKISGDSVAADNLESYTDGTTKMPVDVFSISGDSTAADNLEAATDGTGYNVGGGSIVVNSVTNNVGGNVVGNVNGNVAGSVNSVTTGVTLAASSIGTGTFQEGAINANALATDAAEEIANTVWQADNDTKYGGGQYDADSLGRTILRSSNTQAEVDVNGNNHVSAVVHQMQNNVVTAAALDDSAGQDIADQILGRNIAGGSSAGRLVKDSLRFLRNRFTLVGDVLTVYAEDDTTIAWTAVVSTDEAALPITGSNPAGGAA